MEDELLVDTQKFASCIFRNAFHATSMKNAKIHQWVVKIHTARAKGMIKGLQTHQSKSTVANRCKCTQLQDTSQRNLNQKPHSVSASVSNIATLILCNGELATIEEYGTFVKIVNNDDQCTKPLEGASDRCQEISAKAQCLVHYLSIICEEADAYWYPGPRFHPVWPWNSYR